VLRRLHRFCSALERAKPNPLLQRDVVADSCQPIRERPWHLRSLPALRDLDAVPAVVERARDDEFSLCCQHVKAGDDRLVDALIDCVNRFDPLAHVEHAKLSVVGCDTRVRGDRLGVDQQPVGDEDGVDVAQGVHDALERDASQRPAAERDVESFAREIERLGVMDGESDPASLLSRQ